MMKPGPLPPSQNDSVADLHGRLSALAADAPPQLAALAAWLVDRTDEIAIRSVRQLATEAGSNANTVVRLAQAMGFSGYKPMQTQVRQSLRESGPLGYARRAAALAEGSAADRRSDMQATVHTNIDAIYTPAYETQIAACVPALLAARQVHCIAVRSCYSVAHYLSYTGALAFGNFQPTPAQPGLLVDALSTCTPDDIVIAISYAHYSAEVIRGCKIAHDCGARVIALTDSYASPIARGAWQVFRLPMAGPQLLPSLTSAFHLVERLLIELSAVSPQTEARLRDTESRMIRFGGYVPLSNDAARR